MHRILKTETSAEAFLKLFAVINLLRQSEHPPTPFETAKYIVRCLCSPASHSVWNRFLLDGAVGRTRAMAQPQLIWKLQRSYLTRGANVASKLQWLRQHHEWVARHWPPNLVDQLYRPVGQLLAEFPGGQEGISFRLNLGIDTRFAKEGELVLTLWRCEEVAGSISRHRVAAMAFSIHQHRGEWVAHVGCLQGGAGGDTADLIRQATREFHGLRPKQATMIALYAIASAGGLSHIRAVARTDHVYQSHWRRRGKIRADYDAYWAELGGIAEGSDWRLPAQLSRKTMDKIESKKRSQYRRRHAIEDLLIEQVQSTIRLRTAEVGRQPQSALTDVATRSSVDSGACFSADVPS